MNKQLSYPVGIDSFNRDRRRFLVALADFLADPLVPRDLKGNEVSGTLSAIRQIATVGEVPLDA
jgi:hypothetical protein